MKRLITIALLAAVALSAGAIKPERVKFSCNITTINSETGDRREKFTLNDKDCGWCVLDKSHAGINGILIYRAPYTHRINVFDLRCPVCDRNGKDSSVEMDGSVTVTCPKCKTSYNITTTGYPVNSTETDAWLEPYQYKINGDSIFIDNSPSYESRLRMWLIDQYK